MENSTHSTNCSNRGHKTILLKADTGANVNLMNIQKHLTFCLVTEKLLQLTPIRMEDYGNTGVQVLVYKFHMFFRWKDQVYKQLFYVTDCDKSPNLLSRDACYTLGVLKPCYTVKKELGFSSSSTDSTHTQVRSIHSIQVGKSFPHCKNEGSTEKVTNSSSKHVSS